MKENMRILQTRYWIVELAKDQAYLGRCTVSLIRPCGDLADLKKEEQLEFFEIVKKLEKAVKLSFKAEMFNWSCLMNNSYKINPSNPQVHFHFRPRYRNKVNFEGIILEDKEFAHHYDNKRHFQVSDEILKKIAEKIKSNYK